MTQGPFGGDSERPHRAPPAQPAPRVEDGAPRAAAVVRVLEREREHYPARAVALVHAPSEDEDGG